MNNKRTYTLFSFACLIALVPFFVWLYESYSAKQFSCVTHLIIHKDNKSVSIDENYTFRGKDGVIETSGIFTDSDGTKTAISRKFDFSYTRQGNEYTLLSNESIEDRQQWMLLGSLIPDFFVLRNRGVTVTIKQQKHDGYVFLMDDVPIYYCEKD